MGTVATSTTALATAYGNQRKIDRTQNGVLWALRVGAADAPGFGMYYSLDNGVTWTAGDGVSNGSGSNGTSYVPNASLFIDMDDFAHVAFKDNSNGYLYYRRGTPNAARTAYTWSAATLVSGSNANFDYPDIVAFRDPATAGAWVAFAFLNGVANGNDKVYFNRLNISASGTITPAGLTKLSVNLPTASNTPAFVSADFNHVGDGKTVSGGLPHLYVAWSAGQTGSSYGIRFVKGTYSAGSWTWGTEREIDNLRWLGTASSLGQYWMNTLWDGTRVILTGFLNEANRALVAYDLGAGEAAITKPFDVVITTLPEMMFGGSASYDSAGNLYLFGTSADGSDSGNRTMGYRKWTRSTGGSPAARVALDTTAPNYPYASARRGPQGQAIDYVYTDGTAAPYAVTSGRIVLNQNPTAPTPQSPADNATWDSSTDQTVTQGYSDPDGNPASKVRVYYRPKGTSAPFAVIEQNTTAASGTNVNTTIPAGTWPGEIQWYGQFADSSGAWSDPSPTRTVTGIPAGLAAATGGGGGTAFSAWTISNATENARAVRTTTRALTTTIATVSPLAITVDGAPVSALRNAGYTPMAGDTVQAEYVSGQWIVQDKVVS